MLMRFIILCGFIAVFSLFAIPIIMLGGALQTAQNDSELATIETAAGEEDITFPEFAPGEETYEDADAIMDAEYFRNIEPALGGEELAEDQPENNTEETTGPGELD